MSTTYKKENYAEEVQNVDRWKWADATSGKMAEGIPLKREGTVDDIASTALLFASNLSSYVTADRL